AKTTAWNEFSSTMASAIICLATNQIFNFFKYIFDNMVKNLEGGVKFLMYPRFVQVFLDKQVKDISKHKEIYVTHSHTKKIFTNMKKEGKGFSRPISLVADETAIKEWEDRMERAATTASSLKVEQDSGNINRTQSVATLNESFPQGTDSGSSPRCQDTILRGAEAQIRFETASKQSNDPPLSRVNTLRCGEDSMKLKELMEFCTKLSVRALDL
ncbi:hypothetical protein Tco_0029912, partial [Tanacetum coccineum]